MSFGIPGALQITFELTSLKASVKIMPDAVTLTLHALQLKHPKNMSCHFRFPFPKIYFVNLYMLWATQLSRVLLKQY